MHAGTCRYADGMVVLDRWSTDVEVDVGSDEEHSLTDSPSVVCSGPGRQVCGSV